MAFQEGIRIVPICYNATGSDIPTLADVRAFDINDLEQHLAEIRGRIEGGKQS